MQDGHCGKLQCPIYSRPVEITTLPTTRPSTSASAHQICGNRTISPCFLAQPKITATCLRLWQRDSLISFYDSHLPGAMAESRHQPRLLTHRYTSTVLLLLGVCVSLDCCTQCISRHRRQWLLMCLLDREQFDFFDRGMGHIAYNVSIMYNSMFGYRAVSHRASTYFRSSFVDRRVHIVADEVKPRGKPVFTSMYSISFLAIPLNVCRTARLVYICSAIPLWLPPDCRSASGDGGVDQKVPNTTSPPGV
jgi:hypothetical protein